MIFATSNYHREGDMYPICSMHGIFTYIWLILFNGAYGYGCFAISAKPAVFSTLCATLAEALAGAGPGLETFDSLPSEGRSAAPESTAPHSATQRPHATSPTH